LSRIHKALDAFYLLQKIDWEYDIRSTLEKILGLALEEIEFEEGKQIERGLIIFQSPEEDKLEVHAGWKADQLDLTFSRTVVQQTLATGEAILCENAKDDPRFMQAESIKNLDTLSLIAVPLQFENKPIGALYIESNSPRNLFNASDLDFLKEFTDTLAPYIKTAWTHQGHLMALKRLQAEVSDPYKFSNIIGRSPPMRNVFDMVRIAANVDRTVLLTGESGSGKELIARAVHYNGPRGKNLFVVVDCSSLAEHLLESELFGHRRGAFTGASSDKIGAFEEADGGTVFLDEISDASKPLQQKLRRVLQEGEIRRVGENAQRKVNVRVICATNKNLQELMDKGEFMRDLYFRINKFPICIPPLRERREDIPLLVEHFLEQAAQQSGTQRKTIQADALELLMRRDWAENNVRELRNTVELSVDFCPEGEVTASIIQRVFRVQRGEFMHAPEKVADASPRGDASGGGLVSIRRQEFQEVLSQAKDSPDLPKLKAPFYRIQQEASAHAIVEGLRASDWKLRPAARLLGISPTKLRCVLKEFISETLLRSAGDLKEAGRALDIPLEVLQKKAGDLGLDDVIEKRLPQ
jgi:transcriptional regulator with GAF, ATPase, and Fis domain